LAVLTVYRTPLAASVLGVVTVATANQVQIVAGSITVDYFGTGITYSGTSVTGGTITRTTYSDSANGGLQYEITGLSHAATMIAALNNSGNGEGLTEFLLSGSDMSTGSAQADVLRGWAGSDSIVAGGGNDTLHGAFDQAIDTLRGGAGNDVYVVGGSVIDLIIEAAGEGIDLVQAGSDFALPDQVENLTLTGGIGARATGNSLANLITGSNQNNTLDGGAGSDTLQGGSGNDTFIVGAGDVVSDAGGTDLVETDVSAYVLGAQLEHLRLTGLSTGATGNALPNLLTGNAVANLLAGGDGHDTLTGEEGDDSLAGDAGNDSLQGGSGNDSLEAGDGNDSLQGGEGADTLGGGAGDDTYVFDGPGDVLVELADGGSDTVQSAFSVTLTAHIEALVLAGSAAINGTGNAQANRITGTSAANVLDGGAGADTLEGGNGGDSYYVDHAGDTIVEAGTSGTDAIFSAITWSLAGNPTVENLTLTGSAAVNGTGNAVVNVITGNDGNNVLTAVGNADTLFGGLGDDTLVGTANADRLDGGAGADQMSGGLGMDIYTVDNPLDVVTEVASTAAVDLNDTVNSWISLALPAEVENLTLLGTAAIDASGGGRGTLRGNSGNNLLTGGKSMSGLEGNDTLDSAGTAGSMIGGAGDDTYIVDVASAFVQEDGGGIDTYINKVNVSNLVLPGQIENLTLLAGSNADGNALANLIIGNAGANFLDGAAGADTLQGGLGNDTYYVDNRGDVVVELAGQGADRIDLTAAMDYSLAGTDVETLYAPFPNTRATGNALANLLIGWTGSQTLDGGAGADTLQGGFHDDTYIIDNLGDSIIEGTVDGTDTVRSFLPGTTLIANLENLVLLEGALHGTGNGLANVMTGNGQGNQLSGGALGDTLRGMEGDDTLTGGTGNDSIDGDAGDDTAIFSGLRQAYTVTSNNGSVTVSGADGTDILTGVDRLGFADQVVVLNPNQASGLVTATGVGIAGRTLGSTVAGISDGDGAGVPVFQWFRDEVAVSGATGSDYTLVAADVGSQMRLRVRFVDGGGHTETLWSDPTEVVQAQDLSAPVISSFSPADEARNVPVDAHLVVTFDENVARGTGVIVLRGPGNGVIESYDAASNRVTVAGKTLTIDPTAALAEFTRYSVEFSPTSIEDMWGNGFAGSSAYNFTTQDTTLPTVTLFHPAEGSNTHGVSANIVITFSEAMARGAGTIVLKSGDTMVESWDAATGTGLSVSGSTLTLNPAADLALAAPYTLDIPAGALTDLAGNAWAGTQSYDFTTAVSGKTRVGTADGEALFGDTGNDDLRGNGGDDTLTGGGGNDLITGGEGIDRAVFSGPRAGYQLGHPPLPSAGVYMVADSTPSRDGTDTVAQAEFLVFADRNVDLLMGAKSRAVSAASLKTLEELYVGFFNRVPEASGLAYWIDQVGNQGVTLAQVANQFYDAGVFFGVYQASMSNQQFIQAIYANVLYRPAGSPNAPDADEIAFWNARLVSGEFTKGTMVLKMLSDVHTFYETDPEFGFVAASLNNKAAVANYYAVQQGLSMNVQADNVAFGIALAALITPTDTAAAIGLIGVNSFLLP
jgi:Ca2+-binding RTX toxin-like protein